MSTVGIKELKDRLTHYLRRTKKGEEVVVTERGKPIALIQGIQSAEHLTTQEARLARLAAQGLVTLPTRKSLKRTRPVKVSGRSEVNDFDSSALGKRFIAEKGSSLVNRLLAPQQLAATATITYAEVHAALARKRRDVCVGIRLDEATVGNPKSHCERCRGSQESFYRGDKREFAGLLK